MLKILRQALFCGVAAAACIGQDAGVHRNDVRHSKEADDTRPQLGHDGGIALVTLKVAPQLCEKEFNGRWI